MTTETIELKLYYYPTCFFCMKVLTACREWGLNLPLVNIHDSIDGFKYLLKNGGKTQVPALEINGKICYESDDIIKYLKDNLDELRTCYVR